MAQLSRPYQIALGALAVLVLIWAVALRAHGSNPSQPVPTTPPASAPASATSAPASAASAAKTAASATSAAAEAKAAAAPTSIYHGAAPGVEGLTRAIAKAHGAVAISQQNAQQLQRKSGEASQESKPASTSTSVAGTSVSAATQKKIVAATIAHRVAVRAHNRAVSKPHIGRSAQQVAVEAELALGKTVMLVFWNPRSSVDREVLVQADALAGGSKGTVTVHAAFANQVGLFGKITEVVHVYQTPTILIVNRRGVVSTLTGLTDVFSLKQAVREARLASS